MQINKIIRKQKEIFVIQMKVSELDKTKCSKKFLENNLPDDHIVNIKCFEDGTLDLRGKQGEYRIIVEDVVNKPQPPLSRIIREGCANFCNKCGSTMSRKYWLFGKLYCHQTECENSYVKLKQ